MKILFMVVEHDEEKPVYLKTEAKKGGIFIIDDEEMKEKQFYGKLLFQLEQSIKVLKHKKVAPVMPWKKKPVAPKKTTKTKKK